MIFLVKIFIILIEYIAIIYEIISNFKNIERIRI